MKPTLVLSWEQHDAQHPPNRWSTSEGRTYVLDESDQPPLLWCHRCRRYVTPKSAR